MRHRICLEVAAGIEKLVEHHSAGQVGQLASIVQEIVLDPCEEADHIHQARTIVEELQEELHKASAGSLVHLALAP